MTPYTQIPYLFIHKNQLDLLAVKNNQPRRDHRGAITIAQSKPNIPTPLIQVLKEQNADGQEILTELQSFCDTDLPLVAFDPTMEISVKWVEDLPVFLIDRMPTIHSPMFLQDAFTMCPIEEIDIPQAHLRDALVTIIYELGETSVHV